MNIEQQICSLEYAQKLLTLGVKQDSLFYWVKSLDDWQITAVITDKDKIYFQHNILDIMPMEYCAAFTVAELGELLPKYVSTIETEEDKKTFSNFRLVTGRSYIIKENKPIETWLVNYICDTTNEFRNWLFDSLLTPPIYDKIEANARAKMLIYLIENGYIKNE
jgi:hypothetical protein